MGVVMVRRVVLVVLGSLCLLSSAGAAERAKTRGAGDPVRRAVVDALRPPVERELRQKVVFKIDHLKTQDGWAFLRGVPQQPGGKAVDYRRTPHRDALEAGAFDDWICALLRKRGPKWRVVTYQIGATDVPYEDWDRRYGAPRGLFR
jgi:hypothetical protein